MAKFRRGGGGDLDVGVRKAVPKYEPMGNKDNSWQSLHKECCFGFSQKQSLRCVLTMCGLGRDFRNENW